MRRHANLIILFSRFSLSADYSLWLVPVCIFLGAAISYLLYGKKQFNSEISHKLRIVLFVIRTVYLSFLAFLLLSPFFKSSDTTLEKPIIIYGEDVSQSIEHLSDSADLQYYIAQRNSFLEKLESDFQVEKFSFGESTRKYEEHPVFKDRLTDISSFLTEMEVRYKNRNVGFLMLASDGLYNKGQNPLYRNSDYQYPIHAVALGDTAIKKDARIVRVNHNRISYLGNKFDVEIEISSELLKGQKANLVIQKNGKLYAEKEVNYRSNYDELKLKFELIADEVGMHRFEVQLSIIDGEASSINNLKYFFVDVLEGQQNILILASAPHPDIKAIQYAINNSKNFMASFYIARQFNQSFDAYDMVILHQIPTKNLKDIFKNIIDLELPALYLLGRNTSMTDFNKNRIGITVDKFKGRYVSANPSLNKDFQIFSLNQELLKDIHKYPPLTVPLATYTPQGEFNTLMYQRIGKVQTNYPMIGFFEQEGSRNGVVFGEGLWKWRLFDYQIHGSHEMFDGMIQKFVQYLASKEDRSRFRVQTDASYFEHMDVVIAAEYYDKAYDLNNTFPAEFKMINPKGEVFEYAFFSSGNTYRLDLGKLNEGDYSWKASLNDGQDIHERKGDFSIQPLQLERNSLKARHELLYNLSAKYGGTMFYPLELELFADNLLDENLYKPVMHLKEKTKDLISLKTLFFIVLLLFTIEWFIRKWNGLI